MPDATNQVIVLEGCGAPKALAVILTPRVGRYPHGSIMQSARTANPLGLPCPADGWAGIAANRVPGGAEASCNLDRVALLTDLQRGRLVRIALIPKKLGEQTIPLQIDSDHSSVTHAAPTA